jgi:molybdopterin-guanine dinucleotide biosynthesis protein A
MGRDKSRVQLGRRTLLQRVRAAATLLGLPVRVIRRDAVPRCGPLGGIYTALNRSRADGVLFLACDMPFVSATFLESLLKKFQRTTNPIAFFTYLDDRAGFPCLLPRQNALPIVAQQIAKSELSLQSLARALHTQAIRPSRGMKRQFINVNTPADLKKAAL